MVDVDGDGIPDVLEGALRTGMAEAMRVADMSLAARRERMREAMMDARDAARADESRLSTLASVSREKLRPVMGDQWWSRSTPERAAEMYGEARAWDGIHPQEATFQAYAAEIERRAAERHGMSPADLYQAAYGTGDTKVAQVDAAGVAAPEAGAESPGGSGERLSLDDAHQVAAAAAPDWYRVVEKIDAETDPGVKTELQERLRTDMTVLVDTGQLETDSAKEEWKDYSGRDVSVEAAWRADRMDREKPGAVPIDVLEARSSGSSAQLAGPATEPVPVVVGAAAVSAKVEKSQVKQAVREANADAPEKPAAGKEERSEKTPGTGWDSAGRRERREAKLRGQGFSEDAIAGQRATDWSMRSRRGADAGQPEKVDVSHVQRMRQQSQQKGPGRGV